MLTKIKVQEEVCFNSIHNILEFFYLRNKILCAFFPITV